MIIKIVAAIIPAFCVSLCFFLLHRDPKPEEKTLIAQGWAKPFSVTEYFDRMERESLKLAERKQQYLIVLWWGFDGLRLNEDGTTEWISRKQYAPPKAPNVSATSSEIEKIEKELEEIRKGGQPYPDGYWRKIAILSNLYKIRDIETNMAKSIQMQNKINRFA